MRPLNISNNKVDKIAQHYLLFPWAPLLKYLNFYSISNCLGNFKVNIFIGMVRLSFLFIYHKTISHFEFNLVCPKSRPVIQFKHNIFFLNFLKHYVKYNSTGQILWRNCHIATTDSDCVVFVPDCIVTLYWYWALLLWLLLYPETSTLLLIGFVKSPFGYRNVCLSAA